MDQEYLKKLFDYDPEVGKLIWKECEERGRAKPFTEAGYYNYNCKCRQVKINKNLYKVHRLIWMWFYGKWPDNHIDHINHDPNDNRICNLRDVTPLENHKNHSKKKNNTSGVTGVSWCKRDKKWAAFINIDGKRVSFGRFKDKDEAIQIRKDAEKKYGYHKNHGKEDWEI